MEVLREVLRPEDGRVIVELPEGWDTAEVEVICSLCRVRLLPGAVTR